MKKLGSVEVSDIIFGTWRLTDQNLKGKELELFLEKLLELGIDTIDTAEVYGNKNHEVEATIGEVFKNREDLKEKFKVITKTGIVKHCERVKHCDPYIEYFNFDYDFIVKGIEDSLKNLNKDSIDVLLLHVPDRFANLNEVARALNDILKRGLAKEVGVSNFNPLQFEALKKVLNKYDIKLVTNQIHLNLIDSTHIDNGNTYYLQGEEVVPMFFSPVAGGAIFNKEEYGKELEMIAKEYGISLTQLAIGYLKSQGIENTIVLGTHKIERYEDAIKGLEVNINKEDMHRIYRITAKKY
jgi:predicted oxidoreductase